MFDKPSAKAKSKAQNNDTRQMTKWETLQQHAYESATQRVFHVYSSLRKPHTFFEAVIYILVLCTVMRSLTLARAESLKSSMNNSSTMSSNKIIELVSNHTMTNNGSSVCLQHSGIFANQLSDVSPYGAEFRFNAIEDKTKQKSQASKPSIPSISIPNKKMRQMKSYLDLIHNKAPQKLNVPTGYKIVGSILQGNDYAKDATAELMRQQVFNAFSAAIINIRKHYEKDLLQALSGRAKSDPIYLNSNELIAAVNEFYNEMQRYIIKLSIYKVHYAAADHFHGGNCFAHASIALIEALKQGHTVELITLKALANENESHVFVVIGRDKKSQLSHPDTWGDDATVLDYWAYSENPITGTDLRNHSDKYALYFDKKWKWNAEIFSAKMPSYFTMHNYYKMYKQLRAYYHYCQTLIHEILTTANDYLFEQYAKEMPSAAFKK